MSLVNTRISSSSGHQAIIVSDGPRGSRREYGWQYRDRLHFAVAAESLADADIVEMISLQLSVIDDEIALAELVGVEV